jgi:toxin YoeB
MRDIRFTQIAFDQYLEWQRTDKVIFGKINKLILEIIRIPFTGSGKPEPLKHEFKGYWSRRINEEHRLVYRVADDYIKIIGCKSHYK